ncbi:MAG TPA: ion channel [Acetobacteraceae bacterium]|nr:ion channel [Acetobacteraceae bacterium]HQU00864.1 ion channel [Acetobacteraceae bacterium]
MLRPTRPKPPPLSAEALRAIERRGLARNGFRDLYHWLMTIRFGALLGVLSGSFAAVNVLFAGLYYLTGGLGDAADKAAHDSFADAFFFSVQTISTTGYGQIYPASLSANILSATEIFTGVLGTALATGILFARLSRPGARVMFSNQMIITNRNGARLLMIRAANQRRNQIVEARMSVTITRDEIDDRGDMMRRLIDLPLVRDRSAIFALSWTVMHEITPDSPLFGLDAQAMAAVSILFICSITGVDDTLMANVHARHVYGPLDIRFDHRFVDVIERHEDGSIAVDYGHFHETVPDFDIVTG